MEGQSLRLPVVENVGVVGTAASAAMEGQSLRLPVTVL